MKFSLVVPMYNESSIIAETARTVHEYMSANFDDYEVIFFDDGSKDDSAEIVRALGLPNIRVSGYGGNKGKGAAVRHAMLEAEGDVIMFTDADLAYGTEVIGRINKIFGEEPSTQIVTGSRNLSADGYEGYTVLRKIMSKVYIKVLCVVGGFKLTDSQCGCKAFCKAAAKDIFSKCEVNGFAFDFEAIMWSGVLGYKITEMPVKIINHRESKVNIIKDTFRMLGDLRRIKKRVRAKSKELGLR
ncbi:MAG: glycosyltransferase [Ruminococcaceae bacterium]|nr:glycosyltransferase [Oscillospiraceae bacterium]